jgi:hypothetical protein
MKYLTIASLAFLVASSSAFSQNAPPGNPVNTGFMAQQPNDRLASRLVGLSIQNNGMKRSVISMTSFSPMREPSKHMSSASADFLGWGLNMLP